MLWKVIEQKGGHVCALGGRAGNLRPGREERLLWQGEALDNSEALRLAHQAVPLELFAGGYRVRACPECNGQGIVSPHGAIERCACRKGKEER